MGRSRDDGEEPTRVARPEPTVAGAVDGPTVRLEVPDPTGPLPKIQTVPEFATGQVDDIDGDDPTVGIEEPREGTSPGELLRPSSWTGREEAPDLTPAPDPTPRMPPSDWADRTVAEPVAPRPRENSLLERIGVRAPPEHPKPADNTWLWGFAIALVAVAGLMLVLVALLTG